MLRGGHGGLSPRQKGLQLLLRRLMLRQDRPHNPALRPRLRRRNPAHEKQRPPFQRCLLLPKPRRYRRLINRRWIGKHIFRMNKLRESRTNWKLTDVVADIWKRWSFCREWGIAKRRTWKLFEAGSAAKSSCSDLYLQPYRTNFVPAVNISSDHTVGDSSICYKWSYNESLNPESSAPYPRSDYPRLPISFEKLFEVFLANDLVVTLKYSHLCPICNPCLGLYQEVGIVDVQADG